MPSQSLSSLERVRARIPLRTAAFLSLGVVCAYLVWSAWSSLQGQSHPGPSSLAQLVRRSSFEVLATLGLVGGLLWVGRETPRDLGCQREQLSRQLLVGSGFGIAILVADIALQSLLATFFPRSLGEGLGGLAPGPWNLPVLLVVGVVGGGIGEELQRVFILTRFRNAWGRPGLLAGLVLEAGVFGLGHCYQGWGGVVTGGLSGLLFALVWLRKGRIIEAMAAHACMDALGLCLGAVLGQVP